MPHPPSLFAVLGVALVLLVTGCGGSAGREQRIVIFAATSLTDVFEEAARLFEAERPGARVTLNFAATSTLRAQLEQGARADLFASADERNMELARRAGVIDGAPTIFATNRLAIVTRKEDARVAALEELARPGLKLVVVAPQVPAGAYTEVALERMAEDPRFGQEFVRRLRANVVSQALNVRHAVATVQLGEVDAAIAYVTDAQGPAAEALRVIPFPEELSGRALYPIGTVRGSRSRELAEGFIEFLQSAEGLGVLKQFGFGRP